MAEERAQRRLAAILAADVVGYSRLMEADEASTLAALKARRRDVLVPLVVKHQGRIFKTTGDGVLVEFGSAVNAVQCAVDLQEGMAAANTELPKDLHIVLRIGVNLGDVIVEGSDLYGDGVNIAARLEAIAEPGGILVSGTAYDHIKSKVKVAFDNLGTQNLKNIAEPVRAYRVAGTPEVTLAASKAFADKPSIAVLPFSNMSGDPGQQYFSDGITEDIITELSRFRSLSVIARNSSFQFREKAIDVRRVARELGAQYVVEGSVRRATDRLRVTAQLIDATTGNHLWSDRYDRSLADAFAIQDDVTQAIVTTLAGRVVATGAERARRKPTEYWAAYDFYLQGRARGWQYDMDGAEPFFRRAAQLDPTYAPAFAGLASITLHRWMDTNVQALLDQAMNYGQKAVALDDGDALAHTVLAHALLFARQHDLAGAHYDRAISLNPNDMQARMLQAYWLVYMGRPSDALKNLAVAMQRDPYPPAWFWEVRGMALYQLRRYDDAARMILQMPALQDWDHSYLAACYAMLSRVSDARREIESCLTLRPEITIRLWIEGEPYADPAALQHWIEGLCKAGLPE